jgi:hypothetical protein
MAKKIKDVANGEIKTKPTKTAKKTSIKAPIKSKEKVAKKLISPKPATREVVLSAALAKTAIITVTFAGVSSGNSQIRASLNGVNKDLTSSGNITFTGVESDDVIGIDGSSPGRTRVRINIDSTPTEFNFTGNFNDNFIIN